MNIPVFFDLRTCKKVKATLEPAHALLEKLAEYVMTELPMRKEMDAKLSQKADLLQEANLFCLATFDFYLTTFVHERRLGDLEQRTFGYRVRDKDDAQ